MKPIPLLVEMLLVCSTLLALLSGFIFLHPLEIYTRPSSPAPLKGGIPKVVLLVIDGLRTDHVLSLHRDLDTGGSASVKYHSHIPYVGQMLNLTQGPQNAHKKKDFGAAAFDVMTFTPTVTAPRLLSMVSGTIPGFMSIASNFGASEVTLDNLVSLWHSAGRRIKLFGDNTWSAMFPRHFVEQDPVSSFFVSDHTEVDRNVTRHLRRLLREREGLDTWDVSVLHYLGLDHLGHTHGSQHELIWDKLREMSDVVRTLDTGLHASGCNYVVLVCGDHGMLAEGGHGGSRYDELHTTAVFIGPHVRGRRPADPLLVRQVDLASTLAVLSGVAVPASSLGVPLLPLVAPLLDPYHLFVLYKTEAARLYGVLKASSLPSGDAAALITEAEWLEAKNFDLLLDLQARAQSGQAGNSSGSCVGPQPPLLEVSSSGGAVLQQLAALYEKTCRKASDALVNKMKTYDLPVLVVAAAVLSLLVLGRLLQPGQASPLEGAAFSTVLSAAGAVLLGWSVACGVLSSGSTVCSPRSSVLWLLLPPAVYAVLLFAAAAPFGAQLAPHLRPAEGPFRSVAVVVAGGVAAHTVSMFASSFVEEEHQTLYFLLTSALLTLLLCAVRCCCCLARPAALGLLGAFTSQTTPVDGEGGDIGLTTTSSYDALLQENADHLVRLRGAYDALGSHSSRVTGPLDRQLGQADNRLAGAINRKEAQQQARRVEEAQTMRFSCYTKASLGLLLSVAVFRLCRTWNATGDKWRHLTDTGDFLITLTPVVQACVHMVGLSLLLLADFLCGPLYILGLVHVLAYNFAALPLHYSREFSAGVVYFCAVALLGYGLLRNFFLVWVMRQPRPAYSSRRAAVFLLGLYPHTRAASLYRGARADSAASPRPTVAPDPKGTVMKEENFQFVVRRFYSTSFLLCQLLQYVRLSVTLVWLVLQPTYNVPLCCLLLLQSYLTSSSLHLIAQVVPLWSVGPSPHQTMPQWYAAATVLWMADAFFFAQGNSNSLSTIKVAVGFTGLTSYHAAVHALLITVHTFGAPLLVLLRALEQQLSLQPAGNSRPRAPWHSTAGHSWWPAVSAYLSAWWFLRLITVCACVWNVLIQRNHIFIWSVYMPKLVYQCCHLAVLPFIQMVLITLGTCAA